MVDIQFDDGDRWECDYITADRKVSGSVYCWTETRRGRDSRRRAGVAEVERIE